MRFAYAPPVRGGGGARGQEYVQKEGGRRCSFVFCGVP